MANIISFKVKNFKSYKGEVEFSFRALDSDFRSENFHEVELANGETIRLLNSAVIYGANASGKSNIIWALTALTSYVRNSRTFDPKRKLSFTPFLFAEETKDNPSEFSLEFILNKRIYNYSFSYCKSVITNEILNSNEDTLFSRDENGFVTYKKDYFPEFNDGTILQNHLALSELGLNANPLIQSIYGFISDIKAFPIGNDFSLTRANENVAKEIIVDNSELAKKLKHLIHIADLGIDDISVIKHDESEFQFPESFPEEIKESILKENAWEIKMVHKVSEHTNVSIAIEQESAGTNVLFGVGARVLRVLETGGFLAYDEMNIAMHPRIFQLIVKLFHNSISNPLNAQLIVTTHDTGLLQDCLMRADQVWFAEKSNSGESELFSVQDFFDDEVTICPPYEDWYRAGRFGAVPHLRDIESIFNDDNE